MHACFMYTGHLIVRGVSFACLDGQFLQHIMAVVHSDLVLTAKLASKSILSVIFRFAIVQVKELFKVCHIFLLSWIRSKG